VALRPAVTRGLPFFVRQHAAAAELPVIGQRWCHSMPTPALTPKLLCDSNLETQAATFCALDHNTGAHNLPEAMLSATWQERVGVAIMPYRLLTMVSVQPCGGTRHLTLVVADHCDAG
jgi:hypothetical protein